MPSSVLRRALGDPADLNALGIVVLTLLMVNKP